MSAIDWLLDSDPSIRWQVKRDLLDAPPDEIAVEHARVVDEGWGARLLALQGADAYWAGGANFPEWTGTKPTLVLLRVLGPDPTDRRVQSAVELVRQNVRWEHAGQRFFDGEVEPCINGATVAIGDNFGQDVQGIVDRLLTEQMADGGWNCEQEIGSTRGSFDTTTARRRGEAYLLDRGLLRRQSTGEVINPAYRVFFFPPRWHYDVLRALDYFRDAGVAPDDRITEALDLVEAKRRPDGRWQMEFEYPGEVHFPVDDGVGQPSRWNTLRALRVLRWAGRAA